MGIWVFSAHRIVLAPLWLLGKVPDLCSRPSGTHLKHTIAPFRDLTHPIICLSNRDSTPEQTRTLHLTAGSVFTRQRDFYAADIMRPSGVTPELLAQTTPFFAFSDRCWTRKHHGALLGVERVVALSISAPEPRRLQAVIDIVCQNEDLLIVPFGGIPCFPSGSVREQ